MINNDSNTYSELKINNQWFKRIVFGKEEEDWGNGKCGDCGTKEGQFHYIGCDIERCPKCGLQLISCDCLGDSEEYELGKEGR